MSQPQQSKICQIADQFDQFSWMPSRFFALTGQPVGQYYRPLAINRPFRFYGWYSCICSQYYIKIYGQYYIKMVDILSIS